MCNLWVFCNIGYITSLINTIDWKIWGGGYLWFLLVDMMQCQCKGRNGANSWMEDTTLVDVGTHLFGQQGDEVSLKLRFDHLHHVLDLCGLAAVDQLIQRQQLLRACPALEDRLVRVTGCNASRQKARNWNTPGTRSPHAPIITSFGVILMTLSSVSLFV